MSPGFLAKRSRESAAASFMGDPQTSNTSKEQVHVGAAALPDQIQERRCSYCTTNGIAAQHGAASIHNVSGHPDENGHEVVGTKNGICGEENGSNGTLDMHGSSCQMDDDTVSGRHDENGHGVLGIKDVIFREPNGSNGTVGTHSSSCQMDGMGSEDSDYVVKSPAAPAHDGLRPRLTTSKYFDESSMDEQ